MDRKGIERYMFKGLPVFILMSKGKRLSLDIKMAVLSYGHENILYQFIHRYLKLQYQWLKNSYFFNFYNHFIPH